jgi:hypothetical protein
MMQKLERREGFKHIYTLKEGEDYCFYKGQPVVVHPDRLPKIVKSDGTEHPIKL